MWSNMFWEVDVYVVKYGGMCILRNGGKGGNEDQSEPQGGAGGVTAGS